MKRTNRKGVHLAAAAALMATQFNTLPAHGQDAQNADVQSLIQRVKELEEKVKTLERNREVDQEAAADAQAAQMKKATAQISIGEDGFGFRSANGNFGLKLEGILQVDSRTFFSDHGIPGNDGFLLRRARPILEGTVYRDFDFLFVPDFGTSANNSTNNSTPQIFDAYLNYRYAPELQLRVGKYKEPVGLEQLQTDAYLTFNERSLVTDLVPNRDLGVMLHGQLFGGVLAYAGGIFNGVGDEKNSSNASFTDDKEVAGRLFVQPLKNSQVRALQGLGVGIGGSFGSTTGGGGLPATTGGSTAGYVTDGQEQFFAYRSTVLANGEHWRLSPQGYYYWGPFGLLGEYAISDQDVATGGVSRRLEHKAWQATASWVLTGEDNGFNGVVPDNPFDPRSGHWGAWQIAARYAQLNIDRAAFPVFADPTASASSAVAWSVGLNWWMNRNIKVMLDFSRTTFTGGGNTTLTTAPAIVTRQPENVFFTRMQLAF